MAELDRILTETETTHHQMHETLRRDSDQAVREIIRLRTRFATLVAELMAAMKTDPRLAANHDLAHEFEERFFVIRKRLAEHQARWRSAAIEEDPKGYRSSVEDLARVQDGFYGWAKNSLAQSR
jgi:hypothetical protein